MPNNGCRRCGRCCTSANIRLPGISITDETGFARWLAFHRCDVQDREVGGEKGISVRIPILCTRLGEAEDGTFFCKDYENRPGICREYLCKRAKEETR